MPENEGHPVDDVKPVEDVTPPEGAQPDAETPKADEQEPFDTDRALEKIKKLNSEARSLRERAKAAEKAAEESGGVAERVPELEAENLRLRVALTHGLPVELAGRLKGGTEEELLADAETLLSLFETKRAPTNRPQDILRGGGDPTVEPEELDPRKLAALIPRR